MSTGKRASPAVIVLPTLFLAACTEPAFEFRGYTDLSNCTQVIDAELAAGSGYVDVFGANDPEDPASVVEMTGTLFGAPVQIDVTCTSGVVDSVHYIADATEPRETGALWARFSDELTALFGEPFELFVNDSRARRYLCNNPSPILLEEWLLESEGDEAEQQDEEELPHELYLAIVPEAADCLR